MTGSVVAGAMLAGSAARSAVVSEEEERKHIQVRTVQCALYGNMYRANDLPVTNYDVIGGKVMH